MRFRMIVFHFAVPAAVFVLLLVAGAPVGTALFAAGFAACVSMAVMMAGPHRAPSDERRTTGTTTRDD